MPLDDPPTPPGDGSTGPGAERLQVARRVLEHLAGLGRLPPEAVAEPPWTQAGIVAGIGARQGTVSRVLSQLVAAGAIATDRRHVRSVARRVNVYYLTAMGETVADRIRERPRP